MAHHTDTDTTTTIWSRITGTRTIDGEDWPVQDLLRRVQMPHMLRPMWVIVRGWCGGDSMDDRFANAEVTEYKSRRAAQEAWKRLPV
jgi:hypothetical protein